MYNTPNPCYKCTKRHAKCHANCPDYADWNAEHQAQLEEKRKTIDIAHKIREAEILRNHRIKKKTKRSFGK